MLTKKDFRIKGKEIRSNLNLSEISKKISEKLFCLPEFQNAKSVFTYIAMADEIDTSAILAIKNKNLYVPKMVDKNIVFSKYNASSLTKNKFGILEPKEISAQTPDAQDIIIVPALACDKNFHRIGYGGGYYDRFLSDHCGIKIILCPDELIYNIIPHESFDVRGDIIISETQILRNNIKNRKNHS